MTTSDIRDFPRYSDTLRLRDGRLLSVRFMEPRDREAIQAYYRALSPTSRYNRFLGATSELPPTQLEQFVHIGEDDRFTVLVTTMIDGDEAIVGPAGELHHRVEIGGGGDCVEQADRRKARGNQPVGRMKGGRADMIHVSTMSDWP